MLRKNLQRQKTNYDYWLFLDGRNQSFLLFANLYFLIFLQWLYIIWVIIIILKLGKAPSTSGMWDGSYSLVFLPLVVVVVVVVGGVPTTLVDQLSLKCHISFSGKMWLWEVRLHFSLGSWTEIDTLYVVEITQLKLIFGTSRTTPYFLGNGCQCNSIKGVVCMVCLHPLISWCVSLVIAFFLSTAKYQYRSPFQVPVQRILAIQNPHCQITV